MKSLACVLQLLGCVMLIMQAGCENASQSASISSDSATDPLAARSSTAASDRPAEGSSPADDGPSTAPGTSQPTPQRETNPTPTEDVVSRADSGEQLQKGGPDDVEEISFNDLIIGLQADMVFRPFMLDVNPRVKEVEGRRVSIIGYIHPGVSQSRNISEFILLKNTSCKFGPGGQADHLVQVKLRQGVTTSFTTDAVEVVGRLTINAFQGPDGNTWSIYDIEGESVSLRRR